jgi:5-methylcytosine-specific restriction endonuclease McrA
VEKVNKETRQQVYDKYGHCCAYCGRKIEFKDMQVDHIFPRRMGGSDNIKNLNPSCRRCNHYKRAYRLDRYRELILKLHTKIRNIYLCKTAEDYGIITIKEWDGKFYFEKVGEK